MTHGLHTTASFTSIAKYLDGLQRSVKSASSDSELDEDAYERPEELSGTQHAQLTAWLSFVEARLGDLVVREYESFIGARS